MSPEPPISARLAALRDLGDDDASRSAADEILATIERDASVDDLPALLDALDDEDVSGRSWELLYVAEDLGPAYLEALAERLPSLRARAPQWAVTAVVRLVNGLGDPDDDMPAFVGHARADTDARETLVSILDEIGAEGDLSPERAEHLEAIVANLRAR